MAEPDPWPVLPNRSLPSQRLQRDFLKNIYLQLFNLLTYTFACIRLCALDNPTIVAARLPLWVLPRTFNGGPAHNGAMRIRGKSLMHRRQAPVTLKGLLPGLAARTAGSRGDM